MRLEEALSPFFFEDEVECFSVWKLGELNPLLPRDLFLYQEVKELLAGQDEEELFLFSLNCMEF